MQEFIFSYQLFGMPSKRPSRKRPAQRRKSHKRKNLQFCATVCKCFLQKDGTRGLNAVDSIVNPWDKAWDTRGTVWYSGSLDGYLDGPSKMSFLANPVFLNLRTVVRMSLSTRVTNRRSFCSGRAIKYVTWLVS